MKIKTFKPSFGGSMAIVMFLVIAMALSVIVFEISLHITLLISFAFAVAVLLIEGMKWDEINEHILYGGKLAISPVLILYVIGTVIGSWIASGTVPMIIYWGLKIISPGWFLVTALIVTALTSLATGSSWSTGATVGVALIGIGAGLGINPAMTAGAVVSGSYFGDKMSPLSDTTNLSPGIAEADMFDHIKSMMYTTIPGLLISMVVYAVLGLKFAGQSLNVEAIEITTSTLATVFNFNLLVLIPPIFVIIAAIKKLPALPTLLLSSLIASLLAVLLQGESVTSIAAIMDSGYTSNTGIFEIDKLLSRGGLSSMNWTASLSVIVIAYGGVLEKSGVLEVILEKLRSVTRTVGSLIVTTVLSLIGLNMATASQYMTIIIGGRMFVPAYKEKDLLPQVLSRTLEDAGTLTSVLIPWNLCGLYFAGTLGVSTVAYAPYAVLNWVVPLIAIFYGLIGKFVWKTGEMYSKKTYRSEEVA